MEPYFFTKLLVIGLVLAAVALWVLLRWRLWAAWRFWLSVVGLVLLPTLLLLALWLSPPGGVAGFSGSYAAMGIGPAFSLALCASPIVGAIGFLIGWWLDRKRRRTTKA